MSSRKQDTDFGIVLSLALLAAALLWRIDGLYKAAAGALLATALWPGVYAPLACLWRGLAGLCERFFAAILLAAVFYLLVTPVGLLRRLFAKQARFGQGRESVFEVKDKTYQAGDLLYQY
jgi:hypothetical protein